MEVLGHAVGATANELAIHSMAVMDRFSNGEAYNEAVWIERGRFAVRQSGTVRSVANQSPDPTSIVGNGRCVWRSWLGQFAGRRWSWKIP